VQDSTDGAYKLAVGEFPITADEVQIMGAIAEDAEALTDAVEAVKLSTRSGGNKSQGKSGNSFKFGLLNSRIHLLICSVHKYGGSPILQ